MTACENSSWRRSRYPSTGSGPVVEYPPLFYSGSGLWRLLALHAADPLRFGPHSDRGHLLAPCSATREITGISLGAEGETEDLSFRSGSQSPLERS